MPNPAIYGEWIEFRLFLKILLYVLKFKKFTHWYWNIYKFKTKWRGMLWVYNETIKLLFQYFYINLPKVPSKWDLAMQFLFSHKMTLFPDWQNFLGGASWFENLREFTCEKNLAKKSNLHTWYIFNGSR